MPPEPANPDKLKRVILQGHEDDGVHEKPAAIVAVAMLVAIPLFMLILWLQFQSTVGRRYQGLTSPTLEGPESQPNKSLPGPRLETVPGANLALLRAQEESELNTYGWIDRTNKIIRIPIARAMEMIAKRGLPPPSGSATGVSEYQLILDRSRDRKLAPMKEAK